MNPRPTDPTPSTSQRREARQAMNALRLEVPAAVFDDVWAKVAPFLRDPASPSTSPVQASEEDVSRVRSHVEAHLSYPHSPAHRNLAESLTRVAADAEAYAAAQGTDSRVEQLEAVLGHVLTRIGMTQDGLAYAYTQQDPDQPAHNLVGACKTADKELYGIRQHARAALDGPAQPSPSQTEQLEEGSRAGEAERIARAFHAAYEKLAPEFDYETRPESRVQLWADVPEKNRALMIGTVERLLATGVLRDPSPEVSEGQSSERVTGLEADNEALRRTLAENEAYCFEMAGTRDEALARVEALERVAEAAREVHDSLPWKSRGARAHE